MDPSTGHPVFLNLAFGWLWLLGGIVAGAAVGMRFHVEDWAGGYGAFPRRMIRLAHVSFFGLGFLNILFSLTTTLGSITPPFQTAASASLVVGAVTMPTCCYLTAWKKSFRHLFPIPVLCTAAGVVLLLLGFT